MPNGEIFKGENGTVYIEGIDQGEVPCLTAWTLEATAALSERNNRCMKSNDDGGSGVDAAWATQTVEGKSFSLSLEFFWQQSDEIPASVQLDATNVGDRVAFQLMPSVGVDNVGYGGFAIIESVSNASEVNGDITCSVTLKGDSVLASFHEPRQAEHTNQQAPWQQDQS